MQPPHDSRSLHISGVSVPSTGRSGLQPLRRYFGTQGRWVSVPSTGRSGLQLWRKLTPRTPAFVVSVPSTGRSGLQRGCPGMDFILLAVSVPSTGRSGLQREVSGFVSADYLGFSTLYGSKWVATYLSKLLLWGCFMFQYPLRVEVGCNLFVGGRLNGACSFSTLYGSKWVATG